MWYIMLLKFWLFQIFIVWKEPGMYIVWNRMYFKENNIFTIILWTIVHLSIVLVFDPNAYPSVLNPISCKIETLKILI